MSKAYNVVLAGSYGVGKSSLFKHLSKCDRAAPVGRSIRGWEKCALEVLVGREKVEVVLWDTASMEEHGLTNMTRSYFSQCVGVILVFDAGRISSLYELQTWVKKTEESQWKSSLVLSLWENDCGNYSDKVTPEHIASFAGACFPPIPSDLIFKVQTKNGFGVNESFEKMIRAIHQKWASTTGAVNVGRTGTSDNVTLLSSSSSSGVEYSSASSATANTTKQCNC